jgi:hypothetical protein
MILDVVRKVGQRSTGGGRAVLESDRCSELVEMHSHWVGLWSPLVIVALAVKSNLVTFEVWVSRKDQRPKDLYCFKREMTNTV